MNGVYVVSVEAVPSDRNASVDIRGAYINVYTTASSDPLARAVALREIAAAGWHCVNIDNVSWHTTDTYSIDPAGKEHFDQALVDGVVLVAHIFSIEGNH
jgi:hypothetical protein